MILPSVGGQVTAVSGNTITVTQRDGTAATIHVDTATTYQVQGVTSATLSDIKVGNYVVAQGTLRTDGSLDASVVSSGFHGGPGNGGGWGRGHDGGWPGGPTTTRRPAPPRPPRPRRADLRSGSSDPRRTRRGCPRARAASGFPHLVGKPNTAGDVRWYATGSPQANGGGTAHGG